jgi:hypothetical protein
MLPARLGTALLSLAPSLRWSSLVAGLAGVLGGDMVTSRLRGEGVPLTELAASAGISTLRPLPREDDFLADSSAAAAAATAAARLFFSFSSAFGCNILWKKLFFSPT